MSITLKIKNNDTSSKNIREYVNTYKKYVNNINMLHTTQHKKDKYINATTSEVIKLRYYTKKIIKDVLRIQYNYTLEEVNNILQYNKEYKELVNNSTDYNTLSNIKQFTQQYKREAL